MKPVNCPLLKICPIIPPQLCTNIYMTNSFASPFNIPLFTLHQLSLHPCPQYNSLDSIYFSESSLNHHIKSKHPSTRSLTNLQIILQTDCHASPDPWLQSLSILYNHSMTPPPFRSSIWHFLDSSIKSLYLQSLHHLIQWTLSVTPTFLPPNPSASPPTHLASPLCFYKLILLFLNCSYYHLSSMKINLIILINNLLSLDFPSFASEPSPNSFSNQTPPPISLVYSFSHPY
jgi:hypothetical protein